MAQQPENTTRARLQSAEILYINNILKGIDELIQYRGAARSGVDKIISSLAGLFEEYQKLVMVREMIEEILSRYTPAK